MLSKGTMLVTVTGRRSGRSISTPTNYLQDKNTLWVVSWRERTWWRNLRGGAPVKVLLAGKIIDGRGLVLEEQGEVASSLWDYLAMAPHMSRYFKVGLDKEGAPVRADCEKAAQAMVMVRIDLGKEL